MMQIVLHQALIPPSRIEAKDALVFGTNQSLILVTSWVPERTGDSIARPFDTIRVGKHSKDV
jgi:hypothetical protein